jgi:hypothetical protein
MGWDLKVEYVAKAEVQYSPCPHLGPILLPKSPFYPDLFFFGRPSSLATSLVNPYLMLLSGSTSNPYRFGSVVFVRFEPAHFFPLEGTTSSVRFVLGETFLFLVPERLLCLPSFLPLELGAPSSFCHVPSMEAEGTYMSPRLSRRSTFVSMHFQVSFA